MSKTLVSVVMITYGHEKFVQEAINGVLMQICDFDVELIISNDCSPDDTDKKVRAILDTHPKSYWIKYIKQEINLGMMPNFIFALKQCKGKYIALCEGDDYWTDPYKLHKQVDFMEANEEYIACQHDRMLLYNDNTLVEEKSTDYIFTQCFLFRNKLDKIYFETSKEVLNGDTFLEYYLRLFGTIKYLDFNGAVYRNTGSGVYTFLDEKTKKKEGIITFKQILKMHSMILTKNIKSESKIINSKITEYQFSILISDRKNYKEFIRYFYYLFKYRRLGYFHEYKRIAYFIFK